MLAVTWYGYVGIMFAVVYGGTALYLWGEWKARDYREKRDERKRKEGRK